MEHHFNVEEAQKYGIECAILYYNIRFWINKNKANKKHFYNDRYWTYNSSKAFSELFPYMSSSQIARHLRKLESLGLIISDNFNPNPYDKTKWYSINENSIVQNEIIDDSEINNDCSILNDREFKNEQYFTDNKTDNKQTDNKAYILQKSNFKKWNLTDFENEIKLHLAAVNLSKDDIISFYDYWREMTPSGKMKFQLEKSWQTDLRLKTWERNKSKFSKTTNKTEEIKDKMNDAFNDVFMDLVNKM